jgi:hypothetical protein
MIAWKGHLHSHVYNTGQFTKYGIMIHMVCDSASGCICTIEIYDRRCRPMGNTVESLSQPSEGNGYSVKQDTYNNVQFTDAVLDQHITVCGNISQNHVLLLNLDEEPTKQKPQNVTF